MPYAKDGTLSLDPIEGGIEITEIQHNEAFAAILEGKVLTVVNGKIVLEERKKQETTTDTETEPAEEELLENLRYERSVRLKEATDILDRHRNQKDFGIETTLTEEQIKKWAVYAQVLRDFMENYGDLNNPTWPTKPTTTT